MTANSFYLNSLEMQQLRINQDQLCHRHSNVRWLQTRKETSFDRIEEQTRGKKYHFEKRATDGAQKNKRKLRIKNFY